MVAKVGQHVVFGDDVNALLGLDDQVLERPLRAVHQMPDQVVRGCVGPVAVDTEQPTDVAILGV